MFFVASVIINKLHVYSVTQAFLIHWADTMAEDRRMDDRFRRLAQTPLRLRVGTYAKTPPNFVEIIDYKASNNYQFRNYYVGQTSDKLYCFIPMRMTKITADHMPVTLPKVGEIIYLIPPVDVLTRLHTDPQYSFAVADFASCLYFKVTGVYHTDRVAELTVSKISA